MTVTTPTTKRNSGNSSLVAAKNAAFDEYYTLWTTIENEVNAYRDYDPDVFRDKVVLLPCDDPEWSNFAKFFALNFSRFGLKKLISTSYAPDSNLDLVSYQPTLFEAESPQFDESKTRINGKKFVLTREDTNGDGVINIDDLRWEYLDGDGDFRSAEVSALRDEADVILTNPPFSLGREFIRWVLDAGKKFAIIGPNSFPTTKEIFPLFQSNQLWFGSTGNTSDMVFAVPKGTPIAPADADKAARLGHPADENYDYTRMGNSCWYTNLEDRKAEYLLGTGEQLPRDRCSTADREAQRRRVGVIGFGRHQQCVDGGDGREVGGPQRRDVVEESGDRERSGDTELTAGQDRRQETYRDRVDVEQRQDQQGVVGRRQVGVQSDRAAHVLEVRVRQADTLGSAGRAGGVDQQRVVVGSGLRGRLPRRVAGGVEIIDEQLGPIDVELISFDDDECGVAVIELALRLRDEELGIDRCGDRPEPPRRHHGDEEFDAVRQPDRDDAEGFEEFELLRPVEGEDRYFVIQATILMSGPGSVRSLA